MVVSYQNILDLADVLNNDSPTATEEYNAKFADRSSSNFTPNKSDLNALLNALVGKPDYDWVGKNCEYEQDTCSKEGSSLTKMVKPKPVGEKYSKCNFGDSGSGEYIPQNGAKKKWNCSDLQSCPTDTAYYWTLDDVLANKLDEKSPYLESLEDISKPGRCEQRYLGNSNGKLTTNDPNDPNCLKYTDGDQKTGCIPLSDSQNSNNSENKYNCRKYNEIIEHTEYPSNLSNYKIYSTNDDSINDKCSKNSIKYGSEFSKETDPNLNLINGNAGSSLNQYNKTRDCKIKTTYAKYVKKGNNAHECSPEMPLYPGSDEAETYDLPLNGSETAAEWWNENSCIWINSIPLDEDLNKNYKHFEPPILNGDCRYDDFVFKNSNGIFGSSTNIVTDGSAIAADNGCFGQYNDNDECKSISALIDQDTLENIAEQQGTNGVSLDSNLFPGSNYQSPSRETEEKCEDLDYRCHWIIDEQSNIIGTNAEAVSAGSAADTENNKNNIDGKFKLIAAQGSKSITHSYPCKIDINENNKNRRFLLNDDDYRVINISKSKPANCNLEQKKMILENVGSTGWYTSESNDNINSGAAEDLKLIYAGSSVAGNSGIKLINNSDIMNEVNGYGVGEMWSKAQITSPEYVSTGEVLGTSAQTNMILNELEQQFGSDSNTKHQILKELALNNNNDKTLYYKTPESKIPDSVDAIAKLEYAWVN